MNSRVHRSGAGVSLLALFVLNLYASEPWKKDDSHWTAQDVQRLLSDSPWCQQAAASFPEANEEPPPPGPLPGAAQAGMAGPRGATDGRWDGGVGRMPRGGVPSLPVTVRWDSALPIRKALERSHDADASSGPTFSETQVQKDYILSVTGLVPAGRYKSSGQLDTKSRSDAPEGTARDPQNPEQMLENLMAASMLVPRGKAGIRPEDVKLDAATGALHFFFPRNEVIELADKEVTFGTRFGSMTLRKAFRLKDMSYKGKLEL